MSFDSLPGLTCTEAAGGRLCLMPDGGSAAALAWATRWVRERVRAAGAEGRGKLAIVVDIDGTILTHRRRPNIWKMEPVAPTVRFVRIAAKAGVAVFFVSARTDAVRKHTVEDITSVMGAEVTRILDLSPKRILLVSVPDHLLGVYHGRQGAKARRSLPNNLRFHGVQKAIHRAHIADQGWKILLNIGNKFTDLCESPLGFAFTGGTGSGSAALSKAVHSLQHESVYVGALCGDSEVAIKLPDGND